MPESLLFANLGCTDTVVVHSALLDLCVDRSTFLEILPSIHQGTAE